MYGRVLEVYMLLQIADGVVFGNVDRTAVDTFLPENHLEKGRLSATIAAHEPHAFMASYQKTGTVEQHLLAKGLGNVLNLNHGGKCSK